MTKPLIQIGDEVREMTDAEHAEYKNTQKEIAEMEAAWKAREAARAAALAKLGLTADEITALFG